MNLLLVDDEKFALQGIMDSVEWEKIGIDHVFPACSCSQSMEILDKNPVDICLCDIEMPHGSGIDLVSYIRQHYENIVCIFLTGYSSFEFAQQAVKLHCLDYILKPARPEIIEAVLLKAIAEIEAKRKSSNYQNYGELYVKNVIGKEEEADSKDIAESCVEYIRAHIQEPITVEELAAEHYINPDYLTRLFKKRFNQTPSNYIKEQRMFLAKELLETTQLSVTMISAKTGYENYSAFITSFKKFYGMPPKEYRQLHQKQ